MYQNYPFLPPADWHDFPTGSAEDAALVAQWNVNLSGFTNQGMTGVPWLTPAGNTDPKKVPFPAATNYYNPANGTPAGDPTIVPIPWNVFPGRILGYNPSMPGTTALQLADTGTSVSGTFPAITKDPCTGAKEDKPYGPYGPRGWQDEYCEWSVQYDPGTNNIRRIDFTCENPEYWNTLWMVSPEMVLTQYQQTLDNPNITMADLVLTDANGNTVMDPGTGRPAYNPLNKWNCGPQTTKSADGTVTAGGAMHLTSTPNTIQTEIGLGASATVQRVSGSQDKNKLICCAQFGQIYRNSDPNIGGSVNSIVNQDTNLLGTDLTVSLTNPPGLYIQMPTPAALQQYSMKGNPTFDFSTCFTVKRGYKGTDPNLPASLASINTIAGSVNDFILHLTFEIPQGYSAEDITIDNSSTPGFGKGQLQYGGQIALTFNNHIIATAYGVDTLPDAVGCVGNPDQVAAQPVQLFHSDIFSAMSGTMIKNPVTEAQPLLANSTMIAPLVGVDRVYPMVLVCSLPDGADASTIPVTFYNGKDADPNISATIVNTGTISYAVPGNTYPSTYTYLELNVDLLTTAQGGVRGIALGNDYIMPAMLNVQAFS